MEGGNSEMIIELIDYRQNNINFQRIKREGLPPANLLHGEGWSVLSLKLYPLISCE